MSAVAPAIYFPTSAPTRIGPAIHIPAPAPRNVLTGLVAWVRRALHPEPLETLEQTVSRSLETAFRQFGRELAG